MLAKLFGHQTPPSRQVAKERLQLVLVHDRIKISPAMLDAMREELIGVISRHLDIDRENMQLTFTQGKRLLVDIPVREARPRRNRVGAK
jgi:cell division topological specificity factor